MGRGGHRVKNRRREERIQATLGFMQGNTFRPMSRHLPPWRVLGIAAVVVLCMLGVSGRTQTLPSFDVTSIESTASLSLSAAAGDLDSDGDIDLVVVRDRHPSVLFLNNGDETFDVLTHVLPSGAFTDVCLADFDGDGDLDVIIAHDGGPNPVLLNDGAAEFVAVEQTWTGGPTAGMAVGDLDGDGDCDLLVSEYAAPLCVWLNDGNGCFESSEQIFGAANHRKPVLSDLDDDGDLDAVVPRDFGDASVLLFNRGDGTFQEPIPMAGLAGQNGISAAVTDVDEDGDLDVLHGCHGCPDSLWINGQGVFADSGQALSAGWSYDVVWVDLDSDGHPDLVTANSNSNDQIWLNDGTGQLSPWLDAPPPEVLHLCSRRGPQCRRHARPLLLAIRSAGHHLVGTRVERGVVNTAGTCPVARRDQSLNIS